MKRRLGLACSLAAALVAVSAGPAWAECYVVTRTVCVNVQKTFLGIDLGSETQCSTSSSVVCSYP